MAVLCHFWQLLMEFVKYDDPDRLRADAQAYAIEAIQQKLASSPEYIQLEWVEKWDGKLPQVMGEAVNPFVSFNAENK